LFGFDVGDGSLEPLRAWYKAAPLHQRDTGAFLIAQYETTYADWLAFLRSLPAPERAAHVPGVEFDITIELLMMDDGGEAMLNFYAFGEGQLVAAGLPIIYESRDRRVSQDWLRFPVTGISGEDVRAYLNWLDRTGRVPKARLCREDEWERAARGADGRQYPHGYRLAPDDANFDATYGNKAAYGFDEVGSHPASRSPFGVDDMVGNARELTMSVLGDTKLVVRSGGFLDSSSTNAVVNREYITADYVSPHVGLRVCADPPVPDGAL
jgi:formylglycine-generating enzyme required for sulfatase activity